MQCRYVCFACTCMYVMPADVHTSASTCVRVQYMYTHMHSTVSVYSITVHVQVTLYVMCISQFVQLCHTGLDD